MRDKIFLNNFSKRFSGFFRRFFGQGERFCDAWKFLGPEEGETHPAPFPDNPCIPYMRRVIEAVLERGQKTYREFYPVILDFDAKNLPAFEEHCVEKEADVFAWESRIWEDEHDHELRRIYEQIDSVLYQIAPELNHLMIYTDRAEYFESFIQTMYEENGLLVEVDEKRNISFPPECFVLDFEWKPDGKFFQVQRDIFYLSIYQRPWEIAQNLDIVVPIGYNTMIVKGAAVHDELSMEDKFERNFYLT